MKKRVPWNKGHTKDSHPSVRKIAHTLAAKPRSNFYEYQKRNKVSYPPLEHSSKLAELYGTVLGDGYIEQFPRTERLIISFNSKEKDHIEHIKGIVQDIFFKTPVKRHRKRAQCTDIYIYQNSISSRLKFPTGKKSKHELHIPIWIKNNRKYLLSCLKGLFESDGNWTIDKGNYTNVISFRNNQQHLLDDVYESLTTLGFHPQRRKLDVRLARKAEVHRFAGMIGFRKY
jgi:intein/homing endonuclease